MKKDGPSASIPDEPAKPARPFRTMRPAVKVKLTGKSASTTIKQDPPLWVQVEGSMSPATFLEFCKWVLSQPASEVEIRYKRTSSRPRPIPGQSGWKSIRRPKR